MSFLQVDREGLARRRQSRQRRWLIVGGLLVLLVVLTFARAGGAQLTAPSTAAPGATITVHARGLRSGGQYSLTLWTSQGRSAGAFCEAQIAPAQARATTTFTGTLPSRLPCYAGSSARPRGSIAVGAGAYALVVAQRDGTTFSSHYSWLSHRLRIT